MPFLIKYGFPLNIDQNKEILTDKVNHKSATMFKESLSTEIDHEAILGPFQEPVFPLHISPFLTRDKSSSDKRRVIVDLSWLLGNSVNDAVKSESYLGTDFVLTLPTIDHIFCQKWMSAVHSNIITYTNRSQRFTVFRTLLGQLLSRKELGIWI